MNKKRLVIDTSVAFKWINEQNEQFLLQADLILKRLEKEQLIVIMPELAKYELGNALLYKGVDDYIGKEILARFYAIPIEFIPHSLSLAKDTFEITTKYDITFYDASFIALAKQQNADLVTDNVKHHSKYKGKDIKIVSLKKYK